MKKILLWICIVFAIFFVIGFFEEDESVATDTNFSQESKINSKESSYISVAKNVAKFEQEEFSKQKLITDSIYNDISVEMLYRNPDLYKGMAVKITGNILQVFESKDSGVLDIRIDTAPNNYSENTIVVARYTKKPNQSRFLEGDNICLYGYSDGLKTYTTVMNSDVTVPFIKATYMDNYTSGYLDTDIEISEEEMNSTIVVDFLKDSAFVCGEGKEITFPIGVEPYYIDVYSRMYDDCIVVDYMPDVLDFNFNLGEQAPIYKLFLFEDSIVVFEPDTKSWQGLYDAQKGIYTYYYKK